MPGRQHLLADVFACSCFAPFESLAVLFIFFLHHEWGNTYFRAKAFCIFLNYERTSHSVQFILTTIYVSMQVFASASCSALVRAWLLPQVMPDIKVQPRRPVEEASKWRERRSNVHPAPCFCFVGVGLCSLAWYSMTYDALKLLFRPSW